MSQTIISKHEMRTSIKETSKYCRSIIERNIKLKAETIMQRFALHITLAVPYGEG